VRRSGSGLRIEVTVRGPGGAGARSSLAPFRAAIYDVSGRLVRLLADGRLEDGHAEFLWPGIDQRGRSSPPGVYVVKVRAGRAERATKILW
jgi:flagellar hook assembly protein FlgD